jgi:flagellar hook-associated protein 3 FlgL
VVAGDPPFGPEEAGNIEDVQRDIGFHRDLIQETNLRHLDFIATLEKRIGDIEQIDTTEAVTKLLDQVQALEASFQALAAVHRQSLMNYL